MPAVALVSTVAYNKLLCSSSINSRQSSRRQSIRPIRCQQSDSEDERITLNQDWRAYRAKLVMRELASYSAGSDLRNMVNNTFKQDTNQKIWVHGIPQPEPGCLLISRHSMMGAFSFSIILILDHSDSTGTVGVIINLPTTMKIKDCGVEEHLSAAFGESLLGLGGPLQRDILQVLHARPDVEGALEVLPGLYCGGVHSAAEFVAEGEAEPTEFHLIGGYSGWGPYQLAHEIEREDWHIVAASSATVLDILNERAAWYSGQNEIAVKEADQREAKQQSWKQFCEAAGLFQ